MTITLNQSALAVRLRTVNLHITKFCNLRCSFCFAGFTDRGKVLSVNHWRNILDLLAEAGTEKVNFAGGEPTLYRGLDELIRHAKSLGLTTSIVTNGARFAELAPTVTSSLDWVALSLDSGAEDIQQSLGRGDGDHVVRTFASAQLAKSLGFGVKVNTVVTTLNWREDMTNVISQVAPQRWKVFQVLPIVGQNDGTVADLLVTPEEFQFFISTNIHLDPVAENNDDMTESYVMVDPTGCFFSNGQGGYKYSEPILHVGVQAAYERTEHLLEKTIARDGHWSWKRQGRAKESVQATQ